MLAASAGPGFQNAAVVAQHHQGEQPLAEGFATRVTSPKQRRAVGVDHHEVGFHAGGEAADLVIQRERLGVAQGEAVEALPGGERLAAQLAYLVAGLERGEAGEVGAAADVAGVGDVEADLACRQAVEQAAAEEHVGAGAEGDVGAALGQPATHLLVEVDAVGEGAARADQPGLLIDFEIVAALGEQFGHPVEFAGVLGEVGLQPQARVVAQQAAGGVELLAGGGGREARGQAVAQAPSAVPLADEQFGVANAAVGVVAQRLGGVAIHQHLAGQHAQVALAAGREEGFHRGGVAGAEHLGGGGADPQHLVEEGIGDHLGPLALGEAALFGEGVLVQPVQQLTPVGSHDLQLHVVHVAVDEAGHHQLAAMIHRLDAFGQVWRQRCVVVDGLDAAILQPQRAVGVVTHAAFGGAVAFAGIGIEAQQFGAYHAGVVLVHLVRALMDTMAGAVPATDLRGGAVNPSLGATFAIHGEGPPLRSVPGAPSLGIAMHHRDCSLNSALSSAGSRPR